MGTKKDLKNTILIFNDKSNNSNIEVYLDKNSDTVWMNEQQIADLFQKARSGINAHLTNIFNSGEVDEKSNVRKIDIANSDKPVKFYSLDTIISIGYRVDSKIAIKFRKWATRVLKEYAIKGFALNDELLKNASKPKYFSELLFRIRDIRSSEKNLYSKLLEIYATSIDYDSNDEKTIEFFKTVQNKMHYAISGKTAAQIIYERTNHKEDLMGLTSFKGNYIKPNDVAIAKNYLKEDELKRLNLLVSMFLDYAEMNILDKKPMYMKDWLLKLNSTIELNDVCVSKDKGSISHKQAVDKALKEYHEYKKINNNQLSEIEEEFLKKIKELNLIKKGGKDQ
ncbi:MAG: virulence RhuM family protein [Mycoplasmataceae bacterium]|nr:virulence RhuM family protein [Mycoplasmataceae bacterium]